ncbi:CDP-glycerol glycerophosphotransferase family protein [uncultured Holdemanella sp.]|uniref:CDP-glycerol glycerophosphotransferase family protein n=1 Tax=uncultured Holdemanella sp. TaxID=1763549 RepID=UPI0028049B35|nr:CDP-glycerol glycerophosphotransferase family protein [uncultured Holdemanella sp.]
MNAIKYIQEKGIKQTFHVIYQYKLDIVIQKVLGVFLKNKPLKDIIVIESHNDFDSNGGAFYEYLIDHHYNDTYKIVWLIKHKESLEKTLPKNVDYVMQFVPSFKKNYYKWVAKWFTSDNDSSKKLRKDQTSIYFGHGGFGLKNCKGLMTIPASVDYVAMPSHPLSDIFSDQFMLQPDDPRLCYIGFPYVDNFYSDAKGDLSKVIQHTFKKVILWMPTFRKGGGYDRQDCDRVGELGIPLIRTMEEYNQLNVLLQKEDILLILKIHPKQDLNELKIKDMSNIRILTGETVKALGIDNYRLMKDCDALISDYSSAAYDFLQVNKPIAYDFSDVNDYKLGLVVEDPSEYMAGHFIKNFEDLSTFIKDVEENNDVYYAERQELRKKIFDYYDGNNCKRAVELLGITK